MHLTEKCLRGIADFDTHQGKQEAVKVAWEDSLRENWGVRGPEVLARSLSSASVKDQHGNIWQYNSRSDRHSKIACWAILFDLLETCSRLRAHVQSGEIGFGINHRMVDFKQNRSKDLDLVICTPGSGETSHTFEELVAKYDIDLSQSDLGALASLPAFVRTEVGAVRVALEAKAAMTAHVKACPRLFDELNSSHLTIHGSSDSAIGVGFVMVNMAEEFASSVSNGHDLSVYPLKLTKHRQPKDALRVIDKVKELPRRTQLGDEGYDALSIVVVDCNNQGTPVSIVDDYPAPPAGDGLHYESMIHRVAQLYDARFR